MAELGDRDASGDRPTLPTLAGPGLRRIGRIVLITVVALIGGWLGLLVGGESRAAIGPLDVGLTFTPSLTGDTVIRIPPLGDVTVDSHDGPLRLTATIEGIHVADARRIFADPQVLNGLEASVVADLRRAILELIVRDVLAAGLGAAAFGLLAMRSRRRGLIAGGLVVGLVLVSSATAALTFDEDSILEPKFSGLLTSAPALIGDAELIAANFEDYREGLVSLVGRVSRLYDVTSTLPVYEGGDDDIRVLHVSDLHLNPTSWAVIRSVVDQFDVDVVVDTGDIVHQGTALENAYVDEISTVGVPYVFVRGNHDSAVTQQAIQAEPNAVVLQGDVAEVAGLTFFGVGDPRFTPDKTAAALDDDEVRAAAQRSTDLLRADAGDIDIALMHDPVGARELDGVAPIILTGHMHVRAREALPGGSWMFQQGSTGASGINALRNEEPTPITLSVMYFDPQSKELQAWDDITIGGLGLTSAEIERHLASSFAAAVGQVPATSGLDPDQTIGPGPLE